MEVLVTDGDQRATLAVVRALGRAGISVAVGESRPASLAGVSRYCAKSVCYPSPADDGKNFLKFLTEESQTGQYKLLLPMTDLTMQLISSVRDSLAPRVCLPFPPAALLNRVQDKRETLLLAREVGISYPETYLSDETETLEAAAKRINYPVVIKPRFSRYCQDGHWVIGSVTYAPDAASLLATFRALHAQIPRPLVQEKIQGEGRGVFLLIWNGELKAAFCHRRLREKPPWGGVSVYCESVPLDKSLVEKSFALLRALDWQGVAMVEFKMDNRDGRPKLMEVNGRFWGSLQLAIDAGMDFPLLLYRAALGDNIPPQLDYKVGVKSRWLLGDLDHLLIRLAHSHGPNGSSMPAGSRLRACLNFLNFFESNSRSEVQRFEDIRPGWFEMKSYMRSLLGLSSRHREAVRAH